MLKLLVGDVIEGEVIDLGVEGEGVIKYDTYPIFVPFALPHEKVRVRLNYVKKDYAFGDLIDVLTPSKERVKPICCYFGKCGGCDLQHMSQAMQLQVKRQNVERSLRRNGGFDYDVPPVISCNQWEYRNKLALPFGNNSTGVVVGFYQKRSHKVTPMKYCPLHGEWAGELIADVTEWANENLLSAYDENLRQGLLRHLVARMLDTLSVTLVINGDEVPNVKSLADKLSRHFEDFAIYKSVNKKDTNVILGDNATLVYGKQKEQTVGRYKTTISPLSFLQVNVAVRDEIYSAVASAIEGCGGEILELYSGVGILTAELASRLPRAKILSCEIVKEAVVDAKALIKKLGFEHRVQCVCGDATKFVQNYDGGATAVVLDPPRKGCSAEVLESIIASRMRKIVYASCNPATLARDLKVLLPYYEITALQPYDMFPQTSHVETLAVLCLRDK